MSNAHPEIGPITPGDLGMKAGYKDPETGETFFRPIVGWATVTNYAVAGKQPFVPLVLNRQNMPTFVTAPGFPQFIGVYAK